MSFSRAPGKWAESFRPLRRIRDFAWIDLSILLFVVLLIYALVGVAREWAGPFRSSTEIDLSIWALPRYSFLSTVRGFLSYAISLAFTIAYGYAAAHSRRAERLMIPFLDILQSVPVLGFLPGMVLALVKLFPNSNLGLELTCVLMIFSSQAWNMTFSFYLSVKSLPSELREVAALARLNRWEVLRQLEIPFALSGLLWNSMLSMAGGWFFLMVVESFSLGSQNFRLPGIGSYMAVAIDQKDSAAIVAGIVAMTIVIVVVDRCFWAPLVYASQRFMGGESRSGPKPLVIRAFEQSLLRRLFYRLQELAEERRELREERRQDRGSPFDLSTIRPYLWLVRWGLLCGAVVVSAFGTLSLLRMVGEVGPMGWLEQLSDTLLTGLRVAGAVVLGSLWTIPAGVMIGTHPDWSRRLQPVVQFLAAFPAPMLFPIVTIALIWLGIPFGLGATILMVAASQWYILFNVIGGASLIPFSLIEVATAFRVGGWPYWRDIILPAIFPSLVSGWITAAGGAWNASIVSEYVTFGGAQYVAKGIGSSITIAAQNADYPRLAAGVVAMVTTIVLANVFFWNRLYRLTETRYRLEG